MSESLAPFSCSYTPDVPDILKDLECTLVLSTYQANRVLLLGPGGSGMVQLAREFAKPMGIAVEGDRMALALKEEVLVLANAENLAGGYPQAPHKYDALFMPRSVYYTGELDLHDLCWGRDGLWAVNTIFSCLSLVDERCSFIPRWRPPFVTETVPEDRCHLNGMAMADGEPLYVTAMSRTDTRKGWCEGKLSGGVVLHVPSGEVVLEGLPMPHSPRLFDGTLYYLHSATGELMTADPGKGTKETVARVPGFARGLARHGDYLFVGVSRIRDKHMFSDVPVAGSEVFTGVVIVHIPSGRVAGSIRYHRSCDEIYDVQVLPGLVRPCIVNHTGPMFRRGVTLPEAGWWAAEEGKDHESRFEALLGPMAQEVSTNRQDGTERPSVHFRRQVV